MESVALDVEEIDHCTGDGMAATQPIDGGLAPMDIEPKDPPNNNNFSPAKSSPLPLNIITPSEPINEGDTVPATTRGGAILAAIANPDTQESAEVIAAQAERMRQLAEENKTEEEAVDDVGDDSVASNNIIYDNNISLAEDGSLPDNIAVFQQPLATPVGIEYGATSASTSPPSAPPPDPAPVSGSSVVIPILRPSSSAAAASTSTPVNPSVPATPSVPSTPAATSTATSSTGDEEAALLKARDEEAALLEAHIVAIRNRRQIDPGLEDFWLSSIAGSKKDPKGFHNAIKSQYATSVANSQLTIYESKEELNIPRGRKFADQYHQFSPVWANKISLNNLIIRGFGEQPAILAPQWELPTPPDGSCLSHSVFVGQCPSNLLDRKHELDVSMIDGTDHSFRSSLVEDAKAFRHSIAARLEKYWKDFKRKGDYSSDESKKFLDLVQVEYDATKLKDKEYTKTLGDEMIKKHILIIESSADGKSLCQVFFQLFTFFNKYYRVLESNYYAPFTELKGIRRCKCDSLQGVTATMYAMTTPSPPIVGHSVDSSTPLNFCEPGRTKRESDVNVTVLHFATLYGQKGTGHGHARVDAYSYTTSLFNHPLCEIAPVTLWPIIYCRQPKYFFAPFINTMREGKQDHYIRFGSIVKSKSADVPGTFVAVGFIVRLTTQYAPYSGLQAGDNSMSAGEREGKFTAVEEVIDHLMDGYPVGIVIGINLNSLSLKPDSTWAELKDKLKGPFDPSVTFTMLPTTIIESSTFPSRVCANSEVAKEHLFEAKFFDYTYTPDKMKTVVDQPLPFKLSDGLLDAMSHFICTTVFQTGTAYGTMIETMDAADCFNQFVVGMVKDSTSDPGKGMKKYFPAELVSSNIKYFKDRTIKPVQHTWMYNFVSEFYATDPSCPNFQIDVDHSIVESSEPICSIDHTPPMDRWNTPTPQSNSSKEDLDRIQKHILTSSQFDPNLMKPWPEEIQFAIARDQTKSWKLIASFFAWFHELKAKDFRLIKESRTFNHDITNDETDRLSKQIFNTFYKLKHRCHLLYLAARKLANKDQDSEWIASRSMHKYANLLLIMNDPRLMIFLLNSKCNAKDVITEAAAGTFRGKEPYATAIKMPINFPLTKYVVPESPGGSNSCEETYITVGNGIYEGLDIFGPTSLYKPSTRLGHGLSEADNETQDDEPAPATPAKSRKKSSQPRRSTAAAGATSSASRSSSAKSTPEKRRPGRPKGTTKEVCEANKKLKAQQEKEKKNNKKTPSKGKKKEIQADDEEDEHEADDDDDDNDGDKKKTASKGKRKKSPVHDEEADDDNSKKSKKSTPPKKKQKHVEEKEAEKKEMEIETSQASRKRRTTRSSGGVSDQSSNDSNVIDISPDTAKKTSKKRKTQHDQGQAAPALSQSGATVTPPPPSAKNNNDGNNNPTPPPPPPGSSNPILPAVTVQAEKVTADIIQLMTTNNATIVQQMKELNDSVNELKTQREELKTQREQFAAEMATTRAAFTNQQAAAAHSSLLPPGHPSRRSVTSDVDRQPSPPASLIGPILAPGIRPPAFQTPPASHQQQVIQALFDRERHIALSNAEVAYHYASGHGVPLIQPQTFLPAAFLPPGPNGTPPRPSELDPLWAPYYISAIQGINHGGFPAVGPHGIFRNH